MSSVRLTTVSVVLIVSIALIPLTDWDLRAVWPSLVALVAVFLTRNAFLGLSLGAGVGALFLANGNLWHAWLQLLGDHLAGSLQSPWKAGAIAFTLVLGGFAALLDHSGGFGAFFERIGRIHSARRSRERLQMGVMTLGLVCFFDGLANSMLVGRVTRVFSVRVGLARAKLAYLVDTTSSAVACLAFISTWIAFQLSLIESGFASLGTDENPYVWFVKSIGFNFYCWFALGFAVLTICLSREFGPMHHAQKRCEAEGNAAGDSCEEQNRPVLWTALFPLLVLVFAILAGFYVIGLGEAIREGEFNGYWPVSPSKIVAAFGTSEGPLVLLAGSLIGSLAAFGCCRFGVQGESISGLARVYSGGVKSLFEPVGILVAAWLLGSVISDLGAREVIAGVVSAGVVPEVVPCLVFLTGAVISFSTGTSWGTMGILMPLVFPLIGLHEGLVGVAIGDVTHLYAATIGAVFSGAVFGDHCSPISDTTIVSSIATDIEPHEHVRTQLPYALVSAVAAAAAFLLAGFSVSFWILLPAGILLLAVVLIRLSPAEPNRS